MGEETGVGESRPEQRARGAGWAAALAALYLAIALCPCWSNPLGTGLDASYVWALNWLNTSPLRFGADVVFNYGPLGFLLFPADLGDNRALGVAFAFSAHAGLLALLWGRLRRAPTLAAPLAALCVVLARAAGASVDYLLQAEVVLLLLVALESASAAAMLGAGGLAAVLLFVKASAGLSSAGALGLAGAACLFDRRLRRLAAVGLAGFFATALALGLLMTGSLPALARFLRGSWEISRSYDAAMSLLGPAREVWLALPPAACALALPLWLRRRDPNGARAALLVLPLLFVAFKHGFVRQDLHVLIFFFALLLAAGVVATAARTQAALRATAAWALVSLACTLTLFEWRGVADVAGRARVLSLAAGLDGVRSIPGELARPRTSPEENQRALAAAALPSALRALIGDATVDALPYDLARIPASGLRWSPSPILQAYVAATPWLDARQAAHYRSGRAAQFLLVDFAETLDSRHPLLETPQAWAAIRERYQVASLDGTTGQLLLRRREQPLPETEPRALEWREVPSTEWLTVPAEAALLALEPRVNLRGRLTRAAFRWPALWLDVRYRDGSEGRFRLLPEQLPAGLPVAQLPRSAGELRELLEGKPVAQVAQVKLGGNALKYFAPAMRVRFLVGSAAPR